MVIFSSKERGVALSILFLLILISGYRLIMGEREVEVKRRLVNINTASLDEIASLPGIGKVLASRIIEYRNTHGGFRSKEELIRVKGIGVKKYKVLKGMITIEEHKMGPSRNN
jgi:comEA protein